MYSEPTSHIIHRYGISYHKFADDAQQNNYFDPKSPDDTEHAKQKLSRFNQALQALMYTVTNNLKLNDKPEFKAFVSKHLHITLGKHSLKIGDITISAIGNECNFRAFLISE